MPRMLPAMDNTPEPQFPEAAPAALPPPVPVPAPAPMPAPTLETAPMGGGGMFEDRGRRHEDQSTITLPPDEIGDIPPPPVPPPPAPIPAPTGIPGTFAMPGTLAARPFHTAAFAPPPRFGPGAPIVGGGGMLSPDDAAELLRRMAAGGGQPTM